MSEKKREYHRSRSALIRFKYDPLEELVLNHKRILAKIEEQDLIREGKLILLDSNGKQRGYSYEIHMNLYDKLTKISEALIRYSYARVPETVNVNDDRPNVLIINTTKKGEQYKIGDVDEDTD